MTHDVIEQRLQSALRELADATTIHTPALDELPREPVDQRRWSPVLVAASICVALAILIAGAVALRATSQDDGLRDGDRKVQELPRVASGTLAGIDWRLGADLMANRKVRYTFKYGTTTSYASDIDPNRLSVYSQQSDLDPVATVVIVAPPDTADVTVAFSNDTTSSASGTTGKPPFVNSFWVSSAPRGVNITMVVTARDIDQKVLGTSTVKLHGEHRCTECRGRIMPRDRYVPETARQIRRRHWPAGLRPNAQASAPRISPNVVNFTGAAALSVEHYWECAWYLSWLRSHDAGDSVAEQRALRMISREIPAQEQRHPTSWRFFNEVAAKARAGDPSGIQQYVDTNECVAALQRAGARGV